MTQDEAVTFCEAFLPCWEGGPANAEKLLAFYHPEGQIIDPNHPEGVKGTAQLREFLTGMLTVYPEWKFTIEEILATPEGFVFTYLVDLEYLGKEFPGFRGVDVMTVKDNLIYCHKGYYDRAPLTIHRLEQEALDA